MPAATVRAPRGASRPDVLPRTTRGLIIVPAHRSIREVLDEYRIVPRKRHGQNFLHDPAVAERIVNSAELHPGDRVLEIGPGMGAITRPLLGAGAQVTAVEIDPRLAHYLRDAFAGEARFDLRQADALELAWEGLAPEPFVLVSNLPYSITGPMLDRILRHAPRIRRAVIMIQKEVAARLAAGAGGKAIGAPGVLLRLLFDVERLFDVGSGAFRPAPDVVSSVLRLTPRSGASLPPRLREAVNRAYLHRRKMVRKTLGGFLAEEAELARALEAIGHSASARPEELEPDDWPSLLTAVSSEHGE